MSVPLQAQRRLTEAELAAAIARHQPIAPYQPRDPYRALPLGARLVDFHEPTYVAGRRRQDRAA